MIVNRRRFSRIPIELDAVLSDDSHRHSCRVRNFCSGGLLLESGTDTPWNHGSNLTIELFVESSAEGGVLRFELEVRHVELPFIGVAFVRPPFGHIQRLYRLAQEHKNDSSRLFSGHPSASLRGQVKEFEARFLEGFEGKLNHALREAAKTIQAVEKDQEEPRKRMSLMRLHRTLLNQGSEVVHSARRAIEQGLREFFANSNGTGVSLDRPPHDQLALIDRADFEDWLVANIASRTLESEIGLILQKLNGFMAQSAGRPVRSEQNPVAPAAVVHQIQRGLKRCELSNSELSSLYRFLTPCLTDALKDLYEDALWHVEPTAGTPQPLAPVHAAVQTEPDSAAADMAPETKNDTFQTLRNLFELQLGVRGEGGSKGVASGPLAAIKAGLSAADAAATVYSREDLKRVVDALADAVLFESTGQQSLKQEILRSLNGYRDDVENAPLPEPEGEIIELTERLFKAVEKSPAIGLALKKWLPRLKYVVLKTVLRDQGFFSSEHHPLRVLINLLGRLSAGRLAFEPYDRLMQSLIERVVHDEDDSQTFESLLVEVKELLQRQENGLKRNAERISKALEGSFRLSRARRQVHSDLRSRLVGRTLPKLVLQFLYRIGWRQHLLVSLLKQEEKYREAIGILDLLLQQPLEFNSEDGRRRLADSYVLLSMVRGELNRFGQGSQVVHWIEGLTAWLRHGRSPELETLDASGFEVLEKPFEPEGDCEPLPSAEGLLDRPANRLAAMKPGDWLILREPGRAELFLRLAWADQAALRFSHVDAQGIQDMQLTAQDLNLRIGQGWVHFLEEPELALVERGLYQVVHAAYEDVLANVSQDPLTGLLNRHEFERQLERFLAQSKIDGSRHVFCYLDIDRFNVINNTLGVQAGDKLLKDMAEILVRHAEGNAILARLGGNEYGALLPNCSRKLGVDLAEQVRSGIEKHQFLFGDHSIKITLSIGVAILSDQVDNLNELLKRGGLACLAAKEQGGNRVRAYQPTSRDQARQQEMMAWLTKLEQPLDQLVKIRCQPIVPLRDGASKGGSAKGTHYEVLLAIRGPDDSLLSPVPLIEAAERFNRMIRIDRWVLESIFTWFRNNPDKAAEFGGFSINLSGNSLNDEGFLRDLLDLLKANAAFNRKICFEVTETSAVTNLTNVVDFAREAKSYGCKLSLDDFGTGLSSYAYLQQLPVDYVKIDGVFVRNLVENVKDQALVKSIAELASFMGIETIAEYVENEQVLELLRRLGVNHAQGYHVGKPVLLNQI